MGKHKTTDYLIYRWRYQIGYTLLATLLLVVLYLIIFVAPAGLSKSEMAAAVTSAHTPPMALLAQSPDYVLHLPYHLLQKASIWLFGFSTFAIKLPSVVLALCTIGALYGLLRLWFRRNVAIISSLLAVATGQFLFYTQLGTPEIGYLFWNAALLACASMLARTEKYRWAWLVATVVVAALSIYSPFQIYMVIALVATSLIHPHARFVVFRQPYWLLAICTVLFIVLTLPLTLALVAQPHLLMTLFGLPTDWSAISWQYIQESGLQYLLFWEARSGATIAPVYSLGIFLLGVVGLYRLFTAKYTAKSYIITIWLLFLIPALLLNKDAVSLTFIPLVLLVAHAIDYLIHSWYRLFPLNPYARAGGLIPLSVLVAGLTLSGVEHFVYGYHYDTHASTVFSKDLSLLDTTVKKHSGQPMTLLVSPGDQAFYTTYAENAKTNADITVTASQATVRDRQATTIIADRSHQLPDRLPTAIVVGGTSHDANRFYLYKNTAN